MKAAYSAQQISAAVAALKSFKEKPYVKHQWEEVVLFLSQSGDPAMRDRMRVELESILNICPGICALKR